MKKAWGGQVTLFVYDAAGRLVAEYSTQLAGGGVSYLTQDHLRSTRAVTGSGGVSEVKGRYDYLPFGEEVTEGRSGYGGASVRQKFTGYERDEETEMDFAQARYYSGQHGRFTSPDPALSSGKATEPQSWNRYVYTLNNPLKYVDPSGLIWGQRSFEVDGQKWIQFGWFSSKDNLKLYGWEEYKGPSYYVFANNTATYLGPEGQSITFSLANLSLGMQMSLLATQKAGGNFSAEQITALQQATADQVANTPLYTIEKAVALTAGGAIGGIGYGGLRAAFGSTFTFGAAERQAARLPPVLFYYTDEAGAAAIEASQLGRAGRSLFLTNNGGLTPLQAQLELSLPAHNTARALFAVDTQALSTQSLLRSGRVTGNVFGKPGGGFEFMFKEGTTVHRGAFTRFRF